MRLPAIAAIARASTARCRWAGLLSPHWRWNRIRRCRERSWPAPIKLSDTSWCDHGKVVVGSDSCDSPGSRGRVFAEMRRFDIGAFKFRSGNGGGSHAATGYEIKPPQRRASIGIAFGGGAARGWAHIGVIRGLVEIGLAPDVIAGTSI